MIKIESTIDKLIASGALESETAFSDISYYSKIGNLPIQSALSVFSSRLSAVSIVPKLDSALSILAEMLEQLPDGHPSSAALTVASESFTAISAQLDLLKSTPSVLSKLNSTDYSSILENCISILEALPENVEPEASDDYVTFAKPESKEWDISETIVIPIGDNRVRMKTSDFIDLLGRIFAVLAFIIPLVCGRIDAASNEKYEQQRIEIEQEENQLLSDFLSSIDSSNSSQAEVVEELKKSVLGLHSALVELQDTVQVLESSVHDQDCSSQSQEESPDILPVTDDNSPE